MNYEVFISTRKLREVNTRVDDLIVNNAFALINTQIKSSKGRSTLVLFTHLRILLNIYIYNQWKTF